MTTKNQQPRKMPLKAQAPTAISHCNFTAVHWDAQAVEAVTTVARALENLTKLFGAQNIQVGPMIEIKGE